MTDFGRYRLTYETGADSLDTSVEVSISGEATLTQMLNFFETFLKATGYVFDGKELVLGRSAPDFDLPDTSQDFWENDGFSIVGNPWSAKLDLGKSDTGIAYIGSGLPGAMGEDHLSFSPVRSGFGNNVVTFS